MHLKTCCLDYEQNSIDEKFGDQMFIINQSKCHGVLCKPPETNQNGGFKKIFFCVLFLCYATFGYFWLLLATFGYQWPLMATDG